MSREPKKHRIMPTSLPAKGKIPEPTPPADKRVVFSFVLLNDHHGDLDWKKSELEYFRYLLERLQEVSILTITSFTSVYSNHLRNKPIKWRDSAFPSGFNLSPQLRDYPPYQFDSGYKEGRVFGILIHNTFHVVWLDFKHDVFPRR
jgi:hypothetical protein